MMSPYIIPGLKERPVLPDMEPQRIAHIVYSALGVDTAYMKSKWRKRDKVFARQVAMYMLYKHKGTMTLQEIGKMFNRDHTTVIHSKDTIKDLMFTDDTIRVKVEKIESLISAPL